jgi:2-dehydro-3-deoxyglucarate aldolase
LDVEGLDAILIGPYDLSASMGLTAQFDHPDIQATMDKIRELTAIKSIPAGVHVVAPEPDQLQQRIQEGYRFLAYSIDAVMLQSVVYPKK